MIVLKITNIYKFEYINLTIKLMASIEFAKLLQIRVRIYSIVQAAPPLNKKCFKILNTV
jgi:hypothetical protein